jgi:HEAT repeat protein
MRATLITVCVCLWTIVAGCRREEREPPPPEDAAVPTPQHPVAPPPPPMVDEKEVLRLIDEARSTWSEEKRQAAAEKLKQMGEPVLPVLIRVLSQSNRTSDARDQMVAADYVILHIGPPAIPAVEKLLAENPRRTETAANLLCQLGEPGVKVLERFLDHPNLDLRAEVAYQLSEKATTPLPRLLEAVVPCLELREGNALASALHMVRKSGPAAEKVLPTLLRRSQENLTAGMQYRLMSALMSVGASRPGVSTALVRCFTTEDYGLQMLLQNAVLQLSPEVVPALKAHLAGDHTYARLLAAIALVRLAPETPGLNDIIDRHGGVSVPIQSSVWDQLATYRKPVRPK